MRSALVLVLILPLACKGSHDDATPAESAAAAVVAPAADLDASHCEYFSTSDATALTGLPFKSGVSEHKCQWVDPKGSVVLTVALTGGQSHFDKELKIFPTAQPVQGVGDQAFVMGPVIGVRTGSRFFSISGIVTDDVHSVTTEKLLVAARAVSARLPS